MAKAKTVNYWLMKSEPEAFSIHDLARAPRKTTFWDGVRNYQARNFMRSMKVGDRVLFYHSNADPPCVAGTAVVAKEAYPDFTALDPNDKHYDPKATRENPIWEMVDIRLDEVFPQPVPLDALRATPALKGMELLRRGSRLSVQPVSKEHFEVVLKLAAAAAGAQK
jgi:predicted RNA-binding protein with PUA-like domain